MRQNLDRGGDQLEQLRRDPCRPTGLLGTCRRSGGRGAHHRFLLAPRTAFCHTNEQCHRQPQRHANSHEHFHPKCHGHEHLHALPDQHQHTDGNGNRKCHAYRLEQSHGEPYRGSVTHTHSVAHPLAQHYEHEDGKPNTVPAGDLPADADSHGHPHLHTVRPGHLLPVHATRFAVRPRISRLSARSHSVSALWMRRGRLRNVYTCNCFTDTHPYHPLRKRHTRTRRGV